MQDIPEVKVAMSREKRLGSRLRKLEIATRGTDFKFDRVSLFSLRSLLYLFHPHSKSNNFLPQLLFDSY